jgi:hypothetical protein
MSHRPSPSRPIAAAFIATTALALAVPSAVHAQARLGVVVEADHGNDTGGAEAWGVGGGIRFPLGYWLQRSGFYGEITFDWFFPDHTTVNGASVSQTYWETNFNGVLDLKPIPWVYVGTGLNFTDLSVNTGNLAAPYGGSELGVNLIGGIKLGNRHGSPFAQARYELGGGKQFVVSAGFHF